MKPAKPTPLPPAERLALRVDEAAALLSISRSQAYQLIAEKKLPHVRVGESVRVPRAALEAWLEEQTVPGRPA